MSEFHPQAGRDAPQTPPTAPSVASLTPASPPKRGVVKSVGRFAFYPLVRAAESVSQSGSNIRNTLAEIRLRRERMRKKLREAAPEGLSESERFEALVVANHWTQQQLDQQLVAVRRGKLFAMIGTIVGIFACLVCLWVLPVWAAFVITPGAMLMSFMGGARAVLMGLYQAQLESRRLMRAREYMARPDFFRHLFG